MGYQVTALRAMEILGSVAARRSRCALRSTDRLGRRRALGCVQGDAGSGRAPRGGLQPLPGALAVQSAERPLPFLSSPLVRWEGDVGSK